MQTEGGYDYFRIYTGVSTSSLIELHALSGFNDGWSAVINAPVVVITWHSDYSVNSLDGYFGAVGTVTVT